jgi:hypothetical protein
LQVSDAAVTYILDSLTSSRAQWHTWSFATCRRRAKRTLDEPADFKIATFACAIPLLLWLLALKHVCFSVYKNHAYEATVFAQVITYSCQELPCMLHVIVQM